MKNIFYSLLITVLFSFLFSCQEPGHECGVNETDRIGAKCNDGTTSTATGSGACSSHGGVEYWLCDG